MKVKGTAGSADRRDDEMSDHLKEELLLAFLDEEVEVDERAGMRAHLGGCEACAERLDDLRMLTRRVGVALAELDSEPPWTGLPEPLAAAARADGASVTPIDIAATRDPELAGGQVRRRARLGGRSLAAAAGLVLVLAAGAAAVPGSPVRVWIARSADALSTLLAPESAEEAETGISSVSIEPPDGVVHISIRQPGPGTRVHVRVAETAQASVEAPEARYRVAHDELDVVGGRGDIVIRLPAGLIEATVSVEDRTVARMVDGELRPTPEAESSPVPIILDTEG